MSRYSTAALLGFGSVLSLAAGAASAQPITGYYPGFDDWFWGGSTGSVAMITNSTGVTGSSNLFTGEVDPAVVQDWITHPENNFGLAFIAIPPNHYGNAIFSTHNRTWAPNSWPILTINGDTAVQAKEVAGAVVQRENPTYHESTSDASAPAALNAINGPHALLWMFDTSAIAPGTVVSSVSLAAGCVWSEANVSMDVYKLNKAWDPTNVNYQNLVGDRWTWKGGNGSWDDTNHWPAPAGFPNGDTEIAAFPSAASRITVTADIAISSGGVRFQSPAGYTITGAGSLGTHAGTWMPQATAGDNIIDLPYNNADAGGMNADIATGAKITLAKGITNMSFSRREITKTGGGTLVIAGSKSWQQTTYAGTVITLGARASTATGGVTTWTYTEGGTVAFADGSVVDLTGTINPTQDGTIAGKWYGQVDIGKGSMIIRPNTWDATDTAENHAAKVLRLNNLVKSGLENVQADGSKSYDWLGGGIGSKAAVDRNQVDGAYGVGIMDNNDGFGGSIYTTFAGVGNDTANMPVNADCILLKLTYNGDTDLNGVINTDDYFGMLSGMTGGGTGWTYGDFDYSGAVNSDDYFMFLTGKSAFQNEGAITWSPVSVPEPASLSLLGLSAAGLLARRRK